MIRPGSANPAHMHSPTTGRALVCAWSMAMLCAGAVAQNIPHPQAQELAAPPSVAYLTGQCPAAFPVPTSAQAQSAHLLKLAAQAEICDTRADYFAYRGSLLLMAGRLPEAATNLEKALLLDPELPGAQLDFAQALAQLGQKEAARQLVDQVGDRKDIDPSLRQWLTSIQVAEKTDAWAWSAMVQSSMGRETNLDSATHTDTLTLYLSNGPVTVSLADTERPVAGKGVKNWVAVQGLHILGQGEVRLAAAYQSRNTPGTTLANSAQADAALTYTHPAGPGIAAIRLGGLQYKKENTYAYKESSAQLKYEPAWRIKNCPWSLTWGQAWQEHLTTPTMSGNYQYTRIDGSCKNNSGGITALHLSQGLDRPQDPSRPGGAKKRTEYGLRHDQALDLWGHAAQVSIWARQNISQDRDILSPLLGGTIVQTQRTDIGLGYWWRLHKQWSIGVDLEHTRQESNSELSQLKNKLLYFGIRWTTE